LCIGPYAGVDYNLMSYPLQSRLQHIYNGQTYARVDLNPMPESTLLPSQGLRIWPMLFLTLQDVILGALRQILPQDQPLHALEIASGSHQSFNPRPAIDHSILYLIPITQP